MGFRGLVGAGLVTLSGLAASNAFTYALPAFLDHRTPCEVASSVRNAHTHMEQADGLHLISHLVAEGYYVAGDRLDAIGECSPPGLSDIRIAYEE